ncbi:MAG: MBL fold metallo-hydrolase [Erysipelotrichaceae bacterium]|jgi:competence protein ComEC|nr:MBL fold metallo-hydrolase [Erysipelotrichaceae bacterium]
MLLALFLSLVAGILLSSEGIILSLFLLGLPLVILVRKKRYSGLFIIGTGFAVGILLRYLPFELTHQGRIYGVIIKRSEDYFVIKSLFKRYYIQRPDHSFEVGDFILLQGTKATFNFTTYESRFNFNEYLNGLGVTNSIEVQELSLILKSVFRSHALSSFLEGLFYGPGHGIINGMFFGTTNDVVTAVYDIELGRIFSETGLLHLCFVLVIDRALGRFKKGKVAFLIKFCLVLFLWYLNPASFALMRMLFLYLSILYCKQQRHPRTLTLNLSFGIMMLLYNPFLVNDLAFGFTYFVIIFREFFHPRGLVFRRIKRLLFLFVVTTPLLVYYQGVINIFGLIFVIPLQIMILGGVILSILSLVLPLNFVIVSYEKLFLRTISFVGGVDGRIYFPELTLTGLVFLILGVLGVIYAIESRNKRQKRAIFGIITMPLLITFLPLNHLYESKVVFINVGQGDATLIRHRDLTILIDTGGNQSFEIADEIIIPFLKKEGVFALDYLITTHDDFDHNGGVMSLTKKFPVHHFYSRHNFMPIYYRGTIFLQNHNHLASQDENDSSLVLSFRLSRTNFLLLGDARASVLETIMMMTPTLTADVLKLSHHGARNGTSTKLLDLLKPDEVIISVAAINRYGHPDEDLLLELKKRHIKTHLTSKSGSIEYSYYFG